MMTLYLYLFSDDCGVWDVSKGTVKSYFFEDEGKLTSVMYKNNVYVREKKVDKERKYVELNLQPTEILYIESLLHEIKT